VPCAKGKNSEIDIAEFVKTGVEVQPNRPALRRSFPTVRLIVADFYQPKEANALLLRRRQSSSFLDVEHSLHAFDVEGNDLMTD
jgi:hypothetical protein